MTDAKAELTRSWLLKAKRDLLSAEELSSAEVPLLDTASYHCQQGAEKAIKGFLLYNDIRFEKTHDIELLLSQACSIDPSFSDYLKAAEVLTPLAVEYRYPGVYVEPQEDEYFQAFEMAHHIYNFILQKLPFIVHP